MIDPGVNSSPRMHEVDRTEPSQQRSGSCCRWLTTVGNKMGGKDLHGSARREDTVTGVMPEG